MSKTAPRPADIDFYAEYAVRNPVFHMTYKHTHPFCEIYYLKQGKCTYTANNSHYHLQAGDIFIAAADHAHSTSYSGSQMCERIIIFFDINALEPRIREKYPEILEVFSRSCKVILGQNQKQKIERLFERMLSESSNSFFYSDEIMRLYTTQLIFLLLRHGTYYVNKIRYTKDIETALDYIAENYMNNISMDSVANYCNLSPTYFSKKFKLVAGQSFSRYLQNFRVAKAAQLLLTSDDSITKIAIQCGFSSSNYFKDCFRKLSGLSPREYRKK